MHSIKGKQLVVVMQVPAEVSVGHAMYRSTSLIASEMVFETPTINEQGYLHVSKVSWKTLHYNPATFRGVFSALPDSKTRTTDICS